jgi:heterodisulfide reductase subunit A-like polyferredoxin
MNKKDELIKVDVGAIVAATGFEIKTFRFLPGIRLELS